jgi:hypothetical protein
LTPSVRESLILLEEMLRQIPPAALMQRPELSGDMDLIAKSQRPYIFAATFYGFEPTLDDTPPPLGPFTIPFASAFQNLIVLSTSCSRFLTEGCATPGPLREVSAQSLLLLHRLVQRLDSQITLTWSPNQWLSLVLGTLEHEVLLLFAL